MTKPCAYCQVPCSKPCHSFAYAQGCTRLGPQEDTFQVPASGRTVTNRDNGGPPLETSGGTKHDSGKPRLSLISRDALMEEAAVLSFGATKYDAHNWRKGFDWSRLLDATLRHLHAFVDGEDLDPETGLSHLAHARATIGFLMEHRTRGLGRDDRYKRGSE